MIQADRQDLLGRAALSRLSASSGRSPYVALAGKAVPMHLHAKAARHRLFPVGVLAVVDAGIGGELARELSRDG